MTHVLQQAAGATPEIRLTTESARSSHDQPVLEMVGLATFTFGPADIMGGGIGMLTAAAFVRRWAQRPQRTEEERAAARRFLAQWPEGPQL